jgi:DNA repair protein SbcC/Rad50
MQILAVSLTNFKTHADRRFQFQAGTNAICGENGAGKTSILEAIAWVLFDYNSTYQKSELIRTGCASAQAMVDFTSALDGRCYRIRRCTSKGYELFDPQLDVRLGIKKTEDVTQWLCQHFGIPQQTELSKLFADTIGIPQGTLTSDFLKTTEARKRTFDPILKVEEYKQAYQKSSVLETYATAQTAQAEQTIQYLEQQLSDWEDLKTQHQAAQAQLIADQAQLQRLEQQLATLTAQRQDFQATETQLQTIRTQGELVRGQIDGQQAAVEILITAQAKSQAAADLCQTHSSGYQAHEAATQRLAELEQQWQELQTQQSQQQQTQAQFHTLEAQRLQQETQQKALDKAAATVAQLTPLVQTQTDLEQALATQQQEWQQLQLTQQHLQSLRPQLQQKQQQQAKLTAELAQQPELTQQAAQIPELEQQQQRYQHQLSHLQAARQFQAELQQLVAHTHTHTQAAQPQAKQAQTLLQSLLNQHPKLKTVVQAFQTSQQLAQELLAALQTILADLDEQVAPTKLEQQLTQIQTQLRSAQQAQQRLAAFSAKQEQQQQLTADIAHLQAQQDHAKTDDARATQLLTQQTETQQQLSALQDPKGQIRLLQQQLQDSATVQAALQRLQQQQAEVSNRLRELEQQLQGLPALNQQMAQHKQDLQHHRSSYQSYLQHQQEAGRLAELSDQVTAAQQAIAQLQAQRQVLLQEWQVLSSSYDRQQAEQVNHDYELTRSARDQVQGSLPLKQQQVEGLRHLLQQRQELAETLAQQRTELQTKQQVQQLISNARQVFNQSGPRITRFYLDRISTEADRLFRELLDRPDIALEWTEEYDIRVQERGHWRTFKSLSGGEQMCAALAVRLSLLRIVAEIDIAFFDEPTTNMDQTRRRQLAEALGNLKSFKQLFVISHDDTFENMTENVIRVERDPA